ncbi:MAG: 50S ribosomal protein L32e [Candidatus Woesearchaeota archaeon]|jgi:large subunit ribosomal protein L32e|nr:50S ribosomal protein L32e [Candidatus Woesearchaeota archaeon]
MVKDLLKVRALVKKRKPTYTRQQTNQFAKFKGDGWRKPKGYQSKMRLRRRGHKGMPEVGFGSPKEVRGLNKAGFKEVVVNNVADLNKLNVKDEVAVIGRTVGGKKKVAILEEGKKLKIGFANVFDIDGTIKSLSKEPKKKVEKKSTEKKADKPKAEDKKSEEAVK